MKNYGIFLNKKSKSKEDFDESIVHILVLSARFPSINQPWMDTYLEQLQKNKLKFSIFSANKRPSNYHTKVDRLGLNQSVLHLKISFFALISGFVKYILLNPVNFLCVAKKAFLIARTLKKKYGVNAFKIFLKLLYFGLEDIGYSKFDIIHSHGETLAFDFVSLSCMRQIPLVYTFHGLLPKGVHPLADNKRRTLYGELANVLLNTNFAKKQAQSIGCPPEKIIIIPQGLPLEEYKYSPKKCPARDEILHLLSVGRFHKDKGHMYALLAVARLVSFGMMVQYSLVGVGPEKERLRKAISRLGLASHVHLYENLDDVSLKNLYKEAHVFILPSIDNKHGEHVETQGVVLQEAQASGCIPIATRVGGIPECVNDKQDAILVKDRSSKAICEAVRYLLDRPEEWQSFQENGRRNVEQNFSADVIGKRMAAILRGIAAEGKKN